MPMMSNEQEAGMAAMLCFFRDLITVSPKPVHTQVELLVLLEVLSRDCEIFPTGMGLAMWAMDDEELVTQEGMKS